MSEHDERVEALAKVLEEHEERGGGWFCSCSEGSLRYGWENHLAQALLDSPVMRDLLAAERAKALREAAEQHRDQFGPLGAGSRSWLLRKADRIHPADPEETR